MRHIKVYLNPDIVEFEVEDSASNDEVEQMAWEELCSNIKMRYLQFVKALNAANAVRHCVKCSLKGLGWEDFSITLSFEEEIDDSEEISDYSAFTYSCYVNGISEYIALPMRKFVDNVDIFKISDIVKNYFVEEFS